jgi:serine/threonine protein kinase
MYCAPEQMRDFKNADQRSDVFSLGRMLYELYTGELTSAVQDLAAVPASIAPIIERATQTKPEDRYQTVEKMLEDFDSAMGVILGIVEADSLDNLIEELRGSNSWSDDEVNQLTVLLEEIRTEDELVHAALMKIPAALFVHIATRSHALGRTLVKAFSRHAESQAWPFSYTDSIADVSRSLFDQLEDSEMRADLFQAVLMVGAGHHRWHVMEVAASFVSSVQNANDIAAFTRVLRNHPNESQHIQGYVTRSKLHPSLRQFFPRPDSE